METQNQIKRTLAQPEHIAYVCGLIENDEYTNRKELIATVCQHFGFLDPRGFEQQGGCLKALRELEAAGHFVLPSTQAKTHIPSPRRLSTPVAPAVDVPGQVDQVRGLKIVLVDTIEQMRIWNEMMITEHYLGAGPFVGRQLRYLIYSDHGLLGGLCFAAAALHLADRDAWIGWDLEHRKQYLHYIVGLSRFLIRPCVNCVNLASKSLSMGVKMMVEDFEKRYNYKPLIVESFIESDRSGTCFKAANWHRVGQTKGRGRQDKKQEQSLPIKDIYMYVLDDAFRAKIGLRSEEALVSLDLAEGLEWGQWAQNEFGGAPIGDLRLSNRLVRAANDMSANPGVAYCGLPNVDWAATKGYYRMIDKPDDSAVSMPNIMYPHRERTIRRMSALKDMLCLQDGTDLNYNNLDKCKGLGIIGTNQTGAQSRGLHLHSTLAVTPEGLPLGVLLSTCKAHTPRSSEDNRAACNIPIEEKKSYVWLEHHQDLVEISKQLPDTRLIHVCDREADFFEMFDEQRKHSCVELLVRAKHNRNIDECCGKLFESVSQASMLGRVSVYVPRQSARSKKSKKQAKPKRNERQATLVIRAKKVKLRAGQYNTNKEPIDLWAVHAREEHPPADDKAVEWFLLTTINISSFEDAENCLRWYCMRWRIEDWHRVLKSGCGIENLAHETAERQRRAIAINLIIAWRIMLMTLLGREMPGLPAEILFSNLELKVLRAHAKKKS